MTVVRATLMSIGVVACGYGLWLLWDRSSTEGLVSTAIWLGGGLILHDGLIAGIVIGLGLVGSRVLPVAARAPAAVALVFVGPLSLIAFPMIGGFGAKSANPTLLDRSYLVNWIVLLVVTVVVVAAVSLVRSRSTGAGAGDPTADGDRPRQSTR